jgi:hypothetical protein
LLPPPGAEVGLLTQPPPYFKEGGAMEIYTEGIFITGVTSSMWSVKVEDKMYASSSIKKLRKYMSNPEAKIGCWAVIRLTKIAGINKTKKSTMHVFVDVDSGEYKIGGRMLFTDRSNHVFECTPKPPKDDDETKVIELVISEYLEKWRKKLRRNL